MRKQKKVNNLPKEFYLGAVKYTIQEDNSGMDDKEAYGFIDYTDNLIRYASKVNGKDRAQDAIERVIWHEIVHAVLDDLGYKDLSKDEATVGRLAVLLHQVYKTLK